jgi:phosphoribosylglycinamide formyltransferase-1
VKIVLMASGAGSLAKAIIDAQIESVEIAALIADKACPALEIARAAEIPAVCVPFRKPREEWDAELIATIKTYPPDLVVSVGFMRLLSPAFLKEFRTINTHPALLPLFPGAHAVRDALAAGATETGTTVHWVDEGMDTGPVIQQCRVAVMPGDTEETLHERIKIAERALITETLSDFALYGIPEHL